MKKTGACRFSVVIPCYNEADFIADTLRSLEAQDTTEKYEVIVVDNNCTDETIKIAKKYGARIVSERQPGICAARQAGTEAARGEIIISTDADTIFSPSWLTDIDNEFKSDRQLVAVGGPVRYFDGPWWGKVYTHFLFGGSYAYSLITGHPFYVTATNFAFKKTAWTGYNIMITQGGDELYLLHRLREQGRVRFNNSNSTYTSARRLSRGLIYSVFASFLFYYVGAYYIDRIFKRSIIGPAPAFRNSKSAKVFPWPSSGFGFVLLALMIISVAVAPLRNFIYDSVDATAAVIINALKALA
jgi:glycosyltransferase involved in cell wall biosynthesis